MSISIADNKYRKFLDNPKEITDALDRIEEKHYQDFLWMDALAQAHGKIYDEMAAMRIGKISPTQCAQNLWAAAKLIEKDNTVHNKNIQTEIVLMFQNTALNIRRVTKCDENTENDTP